MRSAGPLLTIVLTCAALTQGPSGFSLPPKASARRAEARSAREGGSRTVAAETRQIDTAESRLTVFVYKSGLFSAFADDHVIDGSIAGGAISDAAPLSVAVEVRAGDLKVRDPNLSAGKRAEVQARMLGPEVLDAEKFPSIGFESTTVEAGGPDRWTVTGRLTIHGATRVATFPVSRANGRYRGSAMLKQRDFGITPISIAGGTVKVKDEIRIEFDLAAR